jgi:hypothetical protein
MPKITIWRGTDADLVKLRQACDRYCSCETDPYTCGPHRMLSDQIVLDHLAFIKASAEQFKAREHSPAAEWF